MSDIAPDGPFRIEIKVALVNGTDTTAEAAYSLPPGKIPTGEDIAGAVKEIMEMEALRQGGYRPMTRHEFVGMLMEERTGSDGWAVPGPDKFHIEMPVVK